MKLQISLAGEVVRPGFESITLVERPASNLDWLVDDCELRELVALDVLDYLPASQIDKVLTHWISKLRKNGTITVGGVDVYDISRRIYIGEIELNEANLIMFGNQDRPASFRKSAACCEMVCGKLRSLGLKITNKQLTNSIYTITAKRI